MQHLRRNTATRITVGPFLDKTDGITPEVALTATNEKLTLTVDDGGVPTLVLDTTATASGGSNDLVHITNDDAGFYDLELAAANVNYSGRARLAITYATDHCPVFHEFMILPEVVFDSLYNTVGARPVFGIIDEGTAQAATATTLQLRSAAAFADNELNGATILITGGSAGVGQRAIITGYVSSTDTATVDTWPTTPTGTITYMVFATPPSSTTALPRVDLRQIAGSNVSTSTAQLGVNVVNLGGTTVDAASGLINANVKQVSTDATAADNLEAMLDGTGGVTLTTALTGNITGNLSGSVGSVTGAVGSVASGGIAAASFAAGAIDAAAIAANAIGASELATDAVNEIVAAVFARAFDATKMSGLTFEQIVGLMASALLAKASGLGTTTATFRNPGDSANAIVATVDADGNRSAVTLTTAAVS